MLTKVLTLVLVVLIGLALGIETARYVHAHATGVDASGVVNIHHALLGFSLLATAGALLLSLRADRRGGLRFGAWLSRQWSRFTTWLELTLNGLFDFDALNVGDGTGPVVLRGDDAKRLLVSLKNHASPEEMARRRQISRERLANPTVTLPGTPEYEACAQDALDDAAKTACTSCSTLGHWSPDCPASRIRAHPSAAEDGLLPCRGCSWCGVDPGDLPNELWTECDGSGRYLPNTEAERQRQLAYLKPPPGTITQNKA
jgi:hypothetical protein